MTIIHGTCDRCGQPFQCTLEELNSGLSVVKMLPQEKDGILLSLCKGCQKNLDDWWKDGEVEKRARAFDDYFKFEIIVDPGRLDDFFEGGKKDETDKGTSNHTA